MTAAHDSEVYEEWKCAEDRPASDDGADLDQVIRVDLSQGEATRAHTQSAIARRVVSGFRCRFGAGAAARTR